MNNRLIRSRFVGVVLIALILITPSTKAEDKIPLQTQILLQKLSEWEEGEKVSFDKNIQKKRDEVAVALKSHLKRATQAGDLKTANLIQGEIDKLSPKSTASHEEKKPKTRTDREIKKIILGEWKLSEGKTAFGSIEFTDDDRLTLKDRTGKEYRSAWRIERRVLQFNQRSDDVWEDIDISEGGDEISLFYRDGQGKRDAVVKYKK